MQFIPFIIYGIVVVVFLVIAGMGIYHMHRFRIEWDQTRKLTYVFILYSASLLAYSVFLMFITDWSSISS